MKLLGPIALVISLDSKEHTHVCFYRTPDGAVVEQPYDFLIDLGQQRLPQSSGEFEVKIIPHDWLFLVRPR